MSGLLADHDLESETGTGSVSVSSVTSPISQSSYNPLLDDLVQQASDDSAYMVMSPATSSGKFLAARVARVALVISIVVQILLLI